MKEIEIPKSVLGVIQKLEAKNFEAFVVGGCVRDLLRAVVPKDWDVTANAKPEEVLKIFPEGKYENKFGTVLVPEKYFEDPLHGMKVLSEEIKIKRSAKNKSIKIAKDYLKRVKCEAHGIDHTERVIKNALEIAKEYPEINEDIQELICWFHDVGQATVPKPIEHIDESQRIVLEELGSVLGEEIAEKISEAVYHGSRKKYKYLEQQILKEADVIEGINVERFKIIKKIGLKEHIEWVKGNYFREKIYEVFMTQRGKELSKEEVGRFNKSGFGFKLKEPKFSENKGIIEITTYRIESKYSDKRHPDEIKFAKTLEEDLNRRDFTVNAMALKIKNQKAGSKTTNKNKKLSFHGNLVSKDYEVVDLFDGQKDLAKKKIRAVGKVVERFDEDALRMMRAIRFASTLSEISNTQHPTPNADLKDQWEVERKTLKAIENNAQNLQFISQERIRDEFEKIILSGQPARGVNLLVETKLMKNIIPEIYQAIGVRQNRHHYHGPFNTVYKHMLASLEKCPSEKLEVRLAVFFHDIGKPRTKEGEGEMASFHGHEYVGARMVEEIMRRLKFSRKVVDKTVLLVKNHMFYYNVDEVGEKGVRKVIRKVGLENINDLIDVRIGDRLGSGVPKAVPYKLRHFKYMVEKVSADPISVGQLKINGTDLIKEFNIEPGPKIGAILEVLLARVIDDPSLNKKEKLFTIANRLKSENLENLRKLAKEKIASEKEKEDKTRKSKYWVK